jgi:hypothetical protein
MKPDISGINRGKKGKIRTRIAPDQKEKPEKRRLEQVHGRATCGALFIPRSCASISSQMPEMPELNLKYRRGLAFGGN